MTLCVMNDIGNGYMSMNLFINGIGGLNYPTLKDACTDTD